MTILAMKKINILHFYRWYKNSNGVSWSVWDRKELRNTECSSDVHLISQNYQECTYLLQIKEPPQNSRCQKDDTKFNTEDPQISGNTIQNLPGQVTWNLGFVHAWWQPWLLVPSPQCSVQRHSLCTLMLNLVFHQLQQPKTLQFTTDIQHGFHIILQINHDYFSKQHYLCYENVMCFLKGWNMIFKYYWDEFQTLMG